MKKRILSILVIAAIITANINPIVFSTYINKSDIEGLNEETTQEVIEKENEVTEENETQEEKSETAENIIESETEDEAIEDKIKQDIEDTTSAEMSTQAATSEEFSIYINYNGNKINQYIKGQVNYLFVPKSIDLSNMVIKYTGNIQKVTGANFDEKTKQITGTFSNESQFEITLTNGQTKKVVIMQSDVPAIFINLDNGTTLKTVNNGSKSTKYPGSVNVTGCEDNANNISQSGIEFKGRGNTTWKMSKKSYQIKLKKKANFLGIGSSNEKKWVLIANYQDPTLLKNKIMNDLCVKSGLSSCPNSSFADLYVNGDYVGNYLVCDKVEIKSQRVNLENAKGVLIELDNVYYNEEDYKFTSKRGNHYVVKEAVSEDEPQVVQAAMNSFKVALNAFENELYSDNPSWNKISKMIDVESFAKYYLINEFAENTDSYYSSCYLYKDGDNDVIHMGPTWDYDAAFAFSKGTSRGENPNTDYTLTYAYSNDMQRLYNFPEFASLVNETYNKTVKPAINTINVNQMSKTYKNSIKINTIVWSNSSSYESLKSKLNTFVEKRKTYYNKRYSNSQIEYSTHVEDVGWQKSKRSGVAGTVGQSKRVEGLKIKIGSGYGENISISYRAHVQDEGWQNWKTDGELAGTTGKARRVEAVKIKLKNSSNYSVRYRVHVQNIGWTDWAYDGEKAGTTGKSLRVEAIEIQIVEKRNSFGSNTKNKSALINYKGHIQNVGDTGYASDGEKLGTVGRSLRLEGLQIELGETLPADIKLEIDEHIQDIGWKYGLTNKNYIGTKGKSLRIEALRFKLKGDGSEGYTIKYRTHVQNVGWQEWKADGKMAGTTGKSLAIEAIQIKIEKK